MYKKAIFPIKSWNYFHDLEIDFRAGTWSKRHCERFSRGFLKTSYLVFSLSRHFFFINDSVTVQDRELMKLSNGSFWSEYKTGGFQYFRIGQCRVLGLVNDGYCDNYKTSGRLFRNFTRMYKRLLRLKLTERISIEFGTNENELDPLLRMGVLIH